MLGILRLKGDAYLVALCDHLSELTGKTISLNSVHLPLSRLERRGLIASGMGEATAVRGGRRKKIYTITREGFAVLEESKCLNDRIWRGYRNPAEQQE